MAWKPVSKEPSPPQRPLKNGYGTLGRPIKLTTNFFEVNVKNKNVKLYHYDVEIKDHRGEEKLPKKKKMIVFEEMKKSFSAVFKQYAIGYDSMKNAYSTVLLRVSKSKPFSVKVKFEQDAKNFSSFTVGMEKVNEATLLELFQCMSYIPGQKKELPTTITQMIEIMFRHCRAKRYEQLANRNFFSLSGEFAPPNYIGGGKEGVTGFFASLRPAAWKDGSILLNLDMAHTAFYKGQPVINYIKETEQMNDNDFHGQFDMLRLKRIEKSLKGLKLRTTYVQRTYKFLSVSSYSADAKTFLVKDSTGKEVKMSVSQYMKKQYDRSLRFPNLNLLKVGNPEKDIHIPIELCEIDKGQKVMKKLNESETACFIRSTAVDPRTRQQQIQKVNSVNKFNDDPMIKALTFTIADKPLVTQGRVLPPPGLTMNKSFYPSQGKWDIRDKSFRKGAELTCWAVVNYNYRTRRDTLMTFINLLVKMGKEKGMVISDPFDIYDWKGRGEPNPQEDFEYYKKQKSNIQLIMCVLPGKKYYGAIKKAGDTVVNIITQCVQGDNVFKCQPQTVGNLLLKINTKMDGVNNIVSPSLPNIPTGLLNFAEPFLIMGADVNHPPAGGDSQIPSLAAVVGSYDCHGTKYALETRVQDTRVEVITDMKEITINLLKTFYGKTRKKPNRIIMFRDGVSESQFQGVLRDEMMAMRAACTSLQPNYTPGITFICVQKRHHTRLFCDEKDGVGKHRNVPPGTVVDRDITHPTETDFYLCSHEGIQGTSKPTHYHLLWDDNDLPIDELQMLTYRLCHVYSRCARAVSIPTPVYYAHLAAFRSKVYVQEMLGNGSDGGSVASGQSGQVCTKAEIKQVVEMNTKKELSKKLFFV